MGRFALSCVALFAAAIVSAPAPVSADLWINELHYDNASTDTGEFVEVVLSPTSSSVDLADVTLTLYNGNGGASYDSFALSGGSTTTTSAGYRIVTLATTGIQNGAPDGLSLDLLGTVIQFLSYEGSFTATDGVANGLTSTDIGVAETSSTLVGDSLQLTGSGTVYADFTWTGPTGDTPGAVNVGQTLAVPEASSFLFGGLAVVMGGIGYARRRRG